MSMVIADPDRATHQTARQLINWRARSKKQKGNMAPEYETPSPEQKHERDLAFKYGIPKVCPVCGSSNVTLHAQETLEDHSHNTYVAMSRIEYRCFWCAHTWAECVTIEPKS